MKNILVDVGSFYTKVCVMRQVPETGGGSQLDPRFEFYGRSFFPTLAVRADDIDKGRIYYEHDGDRYSVGYDCCGSLRLDQITHAFDAEGFSAGKAALLLKKIIFDYADNQDDLDINVVVDSHQRARLFEEIGGNLRNNKVEICAFRGYDRRRITKEVTIDFHLLSSGDAVAGYLDKTRTDFTTALILDVGHTQTKLYVVDCNEGVELFQIGNFGVSSYYEKIVSLLAEENIDDNHYLWLVKQIELGCDEVEVHRERASVSGGNTADFSTPIPRHYDVSLVMENVRWDLNKEFKKFAVDALTSYYTNRVEWPAMLVVTGGGASLNGDILRLSLEEGGYCFDDVYVEKQPMYSVLDGAAYLMSAAPAE